MSESLSYISIDQGREQLFSHFDTDGEMWTGSGPRQVSTRITFNNAFAGPPAVNVSISMWDVGRSANLRAEILAQNISSDGFDMVFRTWGDSQIARIGADWIAIGAAVDPTLWQVDGA
ncbi:H-type lectin domain-containing protein [Palleronia sp. THAF1]|uniref:H-type lectin domain-containing protein n=1 Tax=Palleronia sp. THAF1 TaxID=2587842 RepID=UPI0020C8145E|nr:H-type lectin domain-containing protein [Palleronia sp. THAF1]